MHRRDFLRALGVAAAAGVTGGGQVLEAQDAAGPGDAMQNAENLGAANVPMDGGAYQSVRLAPRPGATRSMTKEQQDALEHTLRCQCGCTLDVYTCRTTDFTCPVSPAMHRDITAMVEGGHSAEEIVAAMVGAYGERVLMAPTKSGFNWTAWIAPFAAVGTGAVVITALVRRWHERAAAVAASAPVRAPAELDATPDELARLERAVREER